MNKSIGILIDVDLLISGAIGVQFEWQKASMDSTTLPINSCKLILRHLNDMEDEHKKFLYPFADGYLELSFIDSLRVDAEITNYLIKKQYDLFCLIEKNQAINKNSKKNNMETPIRKILKLQIYLIEKEISHKQLGKLTGLSQSGIMHILNTGVASDSTKKLLSVILEETPERIDELLKKATEKDMVGRTVKERKPREKSVIETPVDEKI